MSDVRSAEESRKDFSQKKNEIISLLDKTIEFYEREQEEDNASAFTSLKKSLSEGEFTIVVVGEFSSGKSTMLNALMHKKILPSETSETTATVNFLRHTQKSPSGEKGKVYYNDGKIVDIDNTDLDTITKYVSTKGEDVASKISHLDLFLESDFLKDNVTLVDSPGLNGVAEGHREITEQQILKSHASIFMFSSDRPGSKTDFEFIRNLQQKVKTIIFVLNKIDSIKKEEGDSIENVIQTLKNNYKKQFPEIQTVPEIWPISAYSALEARDSELASKFSADEKKKREEKSLLNKFEDRLLNFLTKGEKAKSELLAPVERVLAITTSSKEKYQETINVLSEKIDTSELENQIAQIKDTLKEMEKDSAERKNSVSNKVDTALKEIREDLAAKIEGLTKRKLNEIDSYDDIDELNEYIQSFENKFLGQVTSFLNGGDDDFREKIKYIVQLEYASQAGTLNTKISNIDSDIKLEISNHLSTDEYAVEVGLENMQEKVQALEKELKDLEAEAEKAEEYSAKAKAAERKREQLESKIQKLEEDMENIRNIQLPPVREYSDRVVDNDFKWRGVYGMLWHYLGFAKPEYKTVTRIDSSEQDAAKAEKAARLAEKEKEIEKLTKIHDELNSEDSSVAELKAMRLKAKAHEKRDELTDVINQNKQQIDEKYQKVIKKCKRELRNFCEDMEEELLKQLKKNLQKSKESYVSAIIEIVEASINAEIQEKQERVDSLKEQMGKSEQDKNEKIESLKAKIAEMETLMSNAVDLQTELENIETDQIKEETI